jgi:WD repeat and FYVE domain-containing protein 3
MSSVNLIKCLLYFLKELNLTNASTFRDLSKPMGAQTDNRLVQFQKRFAEWDDPTGSTPAYHYGTHYSSAMIVASYLVRTEPFTQVFLRLQVRQYSNKTNEFMSLMNNIFSLSLSLGRSVGCSLGWSFRSCRSYVSQY